MKNWGRVFVSAFVLALGITSCRQSDFLHLSNQNQPGEVSFDQRIKEVISSQLDILWVIDNSGSMGDDQANVIANTELFMKKFTQNAFLDWKMGLISSDDTDRPYVGFDTSALLNRTTSDPVGVFQSAVRRLGTNGSAEEMFYKPILNTLNAYPHWSRANSTLAVILVTDAEEQSRIPTDEFLADMKKIPGVDSSSLLVYGVLGSVDFGCRQTDSDWDYKGSEYEKLIGITKGKVYKLCSSDFGAQLADLADDIVKHVQFPKIYLQSRPVVSSIKVLYHDQSLRGGLAKDGGFWTYDPDRNAIILQDLSFAVEADASVRVTYDPDVGLPR